MTTLRILRTPVALAALLVTAILCAGFTLAVVELTDGVWVPAGAPVVEVRDGR